jgi:tRNA (uracil-5-)-methyltransferase TRM9
MNDVTKLQLIELNKTFYRVHGESFSNTRSSPWTGWKQTLNFIPNKAISILDVGAGNMRYLHFLEENKITLSSYTAVEQSVEMMQLTDKKYITCITGDALNFDYSQFHHSKDLAICFGFMHHIPGFEERILFLRSLIDVLTPGGTLIISLWNFIHNNDTSKTIPWENYNKQLQFEVEKEDYLLGWKLDNTHPRFCHNFTVSEVEKIKKIFSQYYLDSWNGDGKMNNQNHYLVFQK